MMNVPGTTGNLLAKRQRVIELFTVACSHLQFPRRSSFFLLNFLQQLYISLISTIRSAPTVPDVAFFSLHTANFPFLVHNCFIQLVQCLRCLLHQTVPTQETQAHFGGSMQRTGVGINVKVSRKLTRFAFCFPVL
jgi:hypothetical protein